MGINYCPQCHTVGSVTVHVANGAITVTCSECGWGYITEVSYDPSRHYLTDVMGSQGPAGDTDGSPIRITKQEFLKYLVEIIPASIAAKPYLVAVANLLVPDDDTQGLSALAEDPIIKHATLWYLKDNGSEVPSFPELVDWLLTTGRIAESESLAERMEWINTILDEIGDVLPSETVEVLGTDLLLLRLLADTS
jgi:hypothetical protein